MCSQKSQEEAKGTAAVDKSSPIDLSKFSTASYMDVLARIYNGTPPGVFYSAIAIILGLLFYVYNLGVGHGKQELKDIASAPVTEQKKESQIPISSGSTTEINQQVEKYKTDAAMAKSKIDELQEKIRWLEAELNKKPAYSTCQEYAKEHEQLKKNKVAIEQQILWLLNPQLSQQQIAQGAYFTTEQLNVYSKQAAEYRKTADDTQRQIEAVLELRKKCD